MVKVDIASWLDASIKRMDMKWIMIALAMVCISVSPVRAAVFYVNDAAVGANNGTSWTNAFLDLQDALASATTNDAIWIAKGVYYPDEASAGVAAVTNNDPTAHFEIPAGVRLYGGFSGGETNLNERDAATNPCVLSGDIDQNDTTNVFGYVGTDPSEALHGTNSYNVVSLSAGAPTLLDGLVVTAGWAPGSPNSGAGIVLNDSTVMIRSCTISGNWASYNGGGISGVGTTTITNCIFTANRAGRGGAASIGYSTATYDHCRVYENHGNNCAGLFSENGQVTIRNCVIDGNDGGQGSALFQQGMSQQLVVTNTLITGNHSSANAVVLMKNGESSFINCTFAGNASGTGAGVLHNDGGNTSTVYNCVFYDNALAGNTTLPACSISNEVGTATLVSHSLIANSGGSAGWVSSIGTDDGGNIDANPRFKVSLDPSSAPSTSGDFHLLYGSPAINAGSNAVVTLSTDLDGSPRIDSGTVDLGAYEFILPPSTLFVDRYSPGPIAPYSSWMTAATNLQQAVDALDRVDVGVSQQVWIAEGIYTNATTCILTNGTVSILGGFLNGMTSADQRDPNRYPVVLDGQGVTNRVLELSGSGVELDGFTITNALTTYAIGSAGLKITGATNVVMHSVTIGGCRSAYYNGRMDGLAASISGSGTGRVEVTDCKFLDNATGIDSGANGLGLNINSFEQLTVAGCMFKNNTKGPRYNGVLGGGLYIGNIGQAVVSNSVFRGNGGDVYQGRGAGGGMYVAGATTATIIGCAFDGNYLSKGRIGYGGGALAVRDAASSVRVERCTFTGNENSQGGRGGAVYGNNGSLELFNCLMVSNSADYGGAAYLNAGGALVNCTAAGNNAGVSGGGVYSAGSTITNSIVYGNTLTNVTPDNVLDNGGTYVYTCSSPLLAGEGNIDSNPLLYGYALSTNSPCINAGQNALWMAGMQDLAGNIRVFGQRVDMGAFELVDPIVLPADTDGDGLGDWDELTIYGTNPNLADTDGDDCSDGNEVFIGSDPLSAASVFKLSIHAVGTTNNEMSISWPIFKPGLLYELYANTNLVSNGWFYVGFTTSNNFLRSTTSDSMFYRINVAPNN